MEETSLELDARTASFAEHLRFSPEDLLANRSGKMSRAQLKRTSVDASKLIVFGLVLGAGFVLITDSLNKFSLIVGGMIFVAFFALSWRFLRASVSGSVTFVSGKVTLQKRKLFMGGHSIFLYIADKTFSDISPGFASLFQPDITYRIYYSPSHPVILSVEPA